MNPKLARTKKSLLDALVRLLENQRLEEITVSDLCREAGINRTTFYKYYAVPEDVITEAIEQVLNKVIYSQSTPAKTIYEYMLACCSAFYENRSFMSAYVHSQGTIMHLLHKALPRHMGKLDFLADSRNTFVAGGVSSVLVLWMTQDFPKPPEEMARILTEYTNQLLSENSL